jgi:hypothetical protein
VTGLSALWVQQVACWLFFLVVIALLLALAGGSTSHHGPGLEIVIVLFGFPPLYGLMIIALVLWLIFGLAMRNKKLIDVRKEDAVAEDPQ